MKITIINKSNPLDRFGRPDPQRMAKTHLDAFKSRFPQFKHCSDRAYNGIVVDIDDEDKEDFFEALERAGFDFSSDGDDGQKSNAPKMPKTKPIFSKTSPKLPKSRPVLEKVRPTLPKQ